MSKSRSRVFCLMGVTIAVVVCLGIGLGVGLGVGLHKDHKHNASSSSESSDPANVSSSGVQAVTPLKAWNWQSDKAIGMSLGNMLVLERWMDEDWFTGVCGADCWDEWDLSETLGVANASTVLTAHWNSHISRENITLLKQNGFNHLRVPIGFWALIPLQDDEPYVPTGQLDQLEKLASWAYEEGMYIMLDLHGMPGSQNGLQQSGHNTSDIQFWSQQDRADATVQAAMDHMLNSTYRSVYTALAIVNEPVTYTDAQLTSYDYVAAMPDPIPIVIHDAYKGLANWTSFLQGKNSSLIMMEDHPYPGNTALSSGASASADDILQQVCSKAESYASFPVPVAVTEYSLTSSVLTDDFFKQFYTYQLSAFSASAGSFFWSWKVHPSTNPVVALNATSQMSYSWADLYAKGGIIAAPSEANQTAEAFLASLGNPCNLSTESWSGTVGSS